MELYKNRFRIDSTRLKDWDYSSTGYYFVTICAKNKEKCFGDVVNGELNLSHLGKVVSKCWQEIPHHFRRVKLDAFVVMPNHIHGIIIIENDDQIVETQNLASLLNKFGPQSKNLASIIRGYKIGVKKWSTINNIPFSWQERFYEHIIRNEQNLGDIRDYIVNNPLNWDKDEENLQNKKRRSKWQKLNHQSRYKKKRLLRRRAHPLNLKTFSMRRKSA